MRRILIAFVAALLTGARGTAAPAHQHTNDPTPVFRDASDIMDPQVPDAKVKAYLETLRFPSDPSRGGRDTIKTCDGCDGYVTLEVIADSGAVLLDNRNLGQGGRIVAHIRKPGFNPFKSQKDLGLRWPWEDAWLWVSGKAKHDGFEARLVRIGKNGKRGTQVVEGWVTYCNHGDSLPPGTAAWKPPHPKCSRPSGVHPQNYHLGTWFACQLGCCYFQEG